MKDPSFNLELSIRILLSCLQAQGPLEKSLELDPTAQSLHLAICALEELRQELQYASFIRQTEKRLLSTELSPGSSLGENIWL